MPPLMQLPAYEVRNALLDFRPINDAADSISRVRQENARFGLARDQYNLHAREVNSRLDRQQRADDEWRAIPESEFANVPGGRFIRMAGPEHGPQLATNALYHFKNADIQKQLIQAQAEQARAHAYLYREMAKARGAPQPQPIDPTSGYGLNENGELSGPARAAPQPAPMPPTPFDNFRPGGPRVESQVLGREQSSPGTVTREHSDYGSYGQNPESIPGIVVTPKGVSDPYGSRVAAGQRVADGLNDPARERYLAAKRTQDAFSYLYGKPPAGKAYDSNGKLIPLERKESVTDRQSIVLAQQGLENLDFAEKVLTGGQDANGNVKGGTTYLSQYTGDRYKLPGGVEVGGFGEAGRGFDAARMAVLDLNFAISGKSVSNAEREVFLKLYMPSAGDSLKTQQWKINRARAFFKNALAARKAGASDEEIDGLYRSAILEGQKGMPAGAQPQGGSRPADPSQPDLTNVPTEELLKRLGR